MEGKGKEGETDKRRVKERWKDRRSEGEKKRGEGESAGRKERGEKMEVGLVRPNQGRGDGNDP